MRARLWKWRDGLPGGAILGINIGKNSSTPLEAATTDYVAVFDAIYDLAGYVAINVSSPNTQGLRTLQARDALTTIAGAVIARRDLARRAIGRRIPVLVKISPDLDEASLACPDTEERPVDSAERPCPTARGRYSTGWFAKPGQPCRWCP
ncbi:MAG: hypothetical protein EBT47_09500 [Chloroflexi bacterium]|nr:hypothetical protein [Chloroflexota bacterium]